MFEEVLSNSARTSLAVLGESGILGKAYLAGGTALALQIGHRISVDFDFFTLKKFSEESIAKRLSSASIYFQLERFSEGTILGYVGETRFSLFFYDYPLLVKPAHFSNILVAGIKDIAPMKLQAISDRGTKRDFIDLYFILAIQKTLSLAGVFDLYDKKFKALGQSKMHLLKSLTYFADAEKDEMPRMLKEAHWPTIKNFFEKEVSATTKKILA